MQLKSRMMLLCVVVGSIAACGDSGGSTRGQPVTPQLSAMENTPVHSEELKRRSGLSALPEIRDNAAFMASLRRHDPGLPGTLLIDVAIDESGTVQSVEAAPQSSNRHTRIVLVDRTLSGKTVERPMEARNNPSLLPAARKVMSEVRFTPAERDGKPVAFTLRMTLSFAPPAEPSR